MAERGHSWLQASKGSQRPFDDVYAWGGFRVSVSVSVKLIKHSSTAATRVQRIMGLNKLRAPTTLRAEFFWVVASAHRHQHLSDRRVHLPAVYSNWRGEAFRNKLTCIVL